MSITETEPLLRLRSRQFRNEREATWRQLEELISRVEKSGSKQLNARELIALPQLYRATLSSLSMARSISLDLDLILYLEDLTTRAYFFVYGTHTKLWERVQGFFIRDWPHAVQKIGRETFVAFLVTLLMALSAYMLVLHNPDWFYSFMPGDFSAGRTPETNVNVLREKLYEGSLKSGLSIFAASLFTHNAQIGILSFALGFALGIPTFFLLAYNGLMMGAFVAVYVPNGLGFEVGGWLCIHGTTEIFAIILSGAAGFHMGWKIGFPGNISRMHAAIEAGRTAATVVIGVVIMLFFAGLLEGFGRQLIKVDLARYFIGGAMLCLWLAYFYLPRRAKLAA